MKNNNFHSAILLIFLGFFAFFPCAAQNDSPTNTVGLSEYSMNVTHVLTRFAGNRSNLLEANETFLISYKYPLFGKGIFLRTGVNGDMRRTRELTQSSVNQSLVWFLSGSAGFEKRHLLTPSFSFFYGAELHVYQQNERIVTQLFPQNISFNFNNFSLGASPLFGLYWHPSPHIRLFTESYLRVAYIKTTRSMTPVNSSTPIVLENKEGVNAFLLMPQSIHLSISF